MAFDLGNFAAAVGRTLPGFVEGERMAIQDNWNDLNQFNQVQQGQLQNAWTEATWQPSLDMAYDQARLSGMGVLNNELTTALNQLIYPQRAIQAQYGVQYAPYLAQAQYGALLRALRQAGSGNYGFNPYSLSLLGAMGMGGMGGTGAGMLPALY